MKYFYHTFLLILLGQTFSFTVQPSYTFKSTLSYPTVYTQRSEQSHPHLDISGRSFKGKIKAKGLIGLVSVSGTLSFADGMMTWSAKGSKESAPYLLEQENNMLKFSARLKADGDTFVDWSGFYNGDELVDVQAKWNRVNEDDFIHDLFLPDIVELEFTPKRKH